MFVVLFMASPREDSNFRSGALGALGHREL
jgi:hypothetical protein